MAETVLRPVADKDVPAIVDLFGAAFGHPTTAAHHEWKLRRRETPAPNAWAAFDAKGRAVFHVGAIPCRARLGGAERWVMVVVDVMTAPGARRQGLLTTHFPRIVDAWRDAGVALLLGLPNEAWGSRTEALGWKPLFPIQWLVRPLAPERLLARKLRIPALSRASFVSAAWNGRYAREGALRGVDLTEGPVELDQAWSVASSARPPFVLRRDRAWLDWRYGENPDPEYKVEGLYEGTTFCGYAAYRLHGHSATISDFWLTDDAPGRSPEAVKAVMRRLVAERVDVVRALAVPGTALHRLLRDSGFFRGRHSFGVHAITLDDSIDATALADPSAWWITGGEFDVV